MDDNKILEINSLRLNLTGKTIEIFNNFSNSNVLT